MALAVNQVELQIIRYKTLDRLESWYNDALNSVSNEPIDLKIYQGDYGNIFNVRKDFISKCKTPYLCWIDDDDRLEPGIIQKCVDELNKEENKNICGIYTDHININEDGSEELIIKKEYSREDHAKNINRPFHFLLFRTEAALKCLEYESKILRTDLHLILAYCSLYGDWKYLNELGYYWRNRKNSFGKRIMNFNTMINYCSEIILSKT